MDASASAVQYIVSAYRKAPVTLSLLASYFLSQLVSGLWLNYRLFVSLPGGPLPKNIFGWAVHFFVLSPLSLHSSWTGKKLVRSFLPSIDASHAGKLSTGVHLPPRAGSSPLTAGTIPHRQLDQFTLEQEGIEAGSNSSLNQEESHNQAKTAISHILSTLQKEAECQPSHLRLGPSMIESHSTALFAVSHTLVTGSDSISRSTRSAQFPSAVSRRFLSSVRGEFVHIHCSPSASEPGEFSRDGSLHMTLNPSDATSVIEQGWGELHPLAGFPSYSGFWFGWPAWLTQLRLSKTRSARWWTSTSIPTTKEGRISKAAGLPPTYCLVYQPRNMDEAKIVLDIIGAAISFAIGSRPAKH